MFLLKFIEIKNNNNNNNINNNNVKQFLKECFLFYFLNALNYYYCTFVNAYAQRVFQTVRIHDLLNVKCRIYKKVHEVWVLV